MKRNIDNAWGIFSMWRGWVICSGAFIVLLVLSLWVSPLVLPLIAFTMQFVIFLFVRNNREASVPVCYLLPFVCTRCLFWSGVVMVLINLGYRYGWWEHFIDISTVNPKIPYITVLIIAPVCFVVALWAMLRGGRLQFCRDCQLRHGTPAERGFLGLLFTQEARYQVKLMVIFAGVMTVLVWGYHLICYINVNLNRPDRLIFVWLPSIYLVLTWIYMGLRYISIWSYYCKNVALQKGQELSRVTRIRFLIVSGDNTLLKMQDEHDTPTPTGKYDTPVSVSTPYRENVTLYDADSIFRDVTRLTDFKIRFMYSGDTGNADSNIFHYIVTLPENVDLSGSRLNGEWFNLFQVERMINNHEVVPLFTAEVIRLYSVTMAWKTFDRQGRRLYKIKNYRPTFRLRDINNWDVDFNDPQWLHIWQTNQDQRFWRLRRIWRRWVNGMGE